MNMVNNPSRASVEIVREGALRVSACCKSE